MRQRQRGGRKIDIKSQPKDLNRINHHAAGIDIGAEHHLVAVSPESTTNFVREFGTFTPDLHAIADWLVACKVKSVAMESTGVYWIPLYELLERRGFEVRLVDARKARNVSGRKSDVLDCQWLQQLHSYGLLQGAFRPADEIIVLRGYWRQRDMLVKHAASHIQHMQKALQQMNLRLDNVVTDVSGQTGMAIIKAMLKGERNPKTLAGLRDVRCHSSEEEISASLQGNYRAEHLLALKQAVELYEFYQSKILECEEEIAEYLKTLPRSTDDDPPPLEKKTKRHNVSFDVRKYLFQRIGIDLFRVPGLSADTLLTIYSEVGTDLSAWPTEKAFSSWLCVCPGTKTSGRRVLSRKSKPTSNRAAGAFRQAAVSVGKSNSSLGAFYRRIKSRSGPGTAATATAHKLAKIYYHLVKYHQDYDASMADAYESQYQERTVKSLQRRAKRMGYQLLPMTAPSA